MFADARKIMADQQDRHPFFTAELIKQIKDAAAKACIKGCCWFVGDQQFWPVCNRRCNHHPLPLAARQPVRVLIKDCVSIIQPDPGQLRRQHSAIRLGRTSLTEGLG